MSTPKPHSSVDVQTILEVLRYWPNTEDGERAEAALNRLEEQLEPLQNACEQALLLLERKRFEDDPESKIVRAVLRAALESKLQVSFPASEPPAEDLDGPDGPHNRPTV